jgi:ATPase subunit of ABC transporter with duplicated ATPase domains
VNSTRAALGQVLFSGDDQKSLKVISGGERATKETRTASR